METYILSGSYIAGRVSPSGYLAAVEGAFQALAAGEIEAPEVGHLPGVGDGAFHLKAATRVHGSARAAIKINANFPHNPVNHGLPTIQGFIALLDAKRGCLLALMDSAEITARRTAAASALAARFLARPLSHCLGIIGCGMQARYHLEALRELFALVRLTCYDLDRSKAEALAVTARAAHIEAHVASSAHDVAREADLLVTCTTSTRAFLRAGDVAPGAFIAAIGADSPRKQELDPSLLRIARVVPDVLAQASTMGDLHHALTAGLMEPADIHGELADVVAKRVAGRRDENEIFVFDSTGSAIEDLAAAELVYDSARTDAAAPRLTLGH